MKREKLRILILLALAPLSLLFAVPKQRPKPVIDRDYWANACFQLAKPVLEPMSKGELQKTLPIEVSPIWDGRDKRVTYMEIFGRLMAGIAPWLSLPDDHSAEGDNRKQLREWALKSYTNAVDPQNSDYLLWEKEGQTLVDAAYIANSFIRAPKQLWEPLDSMTKQRYIARFKSLRRVDPPYTNWLLFSAMIETFLVSINEQYDAFRIDMAMRKVDEWYVGDGWYSDGPDFAFDYYNSYVIQPMTFEIIEILKSKKTGVKFTPNVAVVNKRMQRYSEILERLISPEGTFPAFGRSITYRMGVFQPLALLSWKQQLPSTLTEGQVRAGLTAVMKRMFAMEGNFSKEGYLQLGFAGHQAAVADRYTNTGSLYMTSLVFLPLGLPADHSFWNVPAEDWTSKKAWSGKDFPRDHALAN